MRDEMRRRPDRLTLALRLSGERLQIAALLGGSEAAGQGESSVPRHTSRSTPQDHLVFLFSIKGSSILSQSAGAKR